MIPADQARGSNGTSQGSQSSSLRNSRSSPNNSQLSDSSDSQNLQSSLFVAYERRKKEEEKKQESEQNLSTSTPSQQTEKPQENEFKYAWNVFHNIALKPLLVGLILGTTHLAIISVVSYYYPKGKAALDVTKKK